MSSALVRALLAGSAVLSAELRPPRAELDAAAGRDAWIDTYHAVRGLVQTNTFVFLTDSAVGAREEHNLRHLVINLGADVSHEHVVPFLTTKHPLDFCLRYADRAWQEGFRSLVVLGGDRTVGPPRCVNHAWELRERIRARVPGLALGGWANPHADPAAQVGFLEDPRFCGEFYLTQIISHHDRRQIEGFVAELDRRHVALPGLFGVFYYRSANQRTLEQLQRFLPVPGDALTAEFAAGATPEEICARTLQALWAAGVRHCYISNLPVATARATLQRILRLAGSAAGPQTWPEAPEPTPAPRR
jgi:hypothetical protein